MTRTNRPPTFARTEHDMQTAAPITIGSIIIEALRAERATAFAGSQWKRNTRLASALLAGRLLDLGIAPADRDLADAQLVAVMNAARDAVKGTDARYAYAIRLTLHALDNPLER